MKKMYGQFLLVICLFLFGGLARAQSNTDSLNTWIDSQLNATNDTIEVFKNAHLSLYHSTKENNSSGIITSYLNLARYHEKYGQLDSAIFYYFILKDIYKSNGNKIAVAESCIELKGLYGAKAEYSDAMNQVFEALEIYEKENDLEGIALCYVHLCDLLYYEDKYEESVDYCDKAITIQVELDAKKDIGLAYRYKASSLLFIEGELELALETINKGIDTYKSTGETGLPLLACINGRGNILKYMERYDEAIADYQYIYDKVLDMGLENYAIPPIANIGHVYILQKKFKEALPYQLEAIELMNKSGNTKNLWENYMHVSDIYEGLGDFKKANDYNKLYSKEYSKYLYSIINRLESEAQIKYETTKKDEQINQQKEIISSQRKVQLLYISIALLLIASLIGMLNSRMKIRKKQTEIEKSKQELQYSLESLKATQSQLIHAEKMASLGELTAGIAHEIQNPLNFVNNFSEVSVDLIEEMNEEMETGNLDEVKVISDSLKQNLDKITYHGQRASSIVKGMLEHSRSGDGHKELTDINILTEEYLRLAYHGFRAKGKSAKGYQEGFNAAFKTELDPGLPEVKVVTQDIARVVLNIINNAFYTVSEKASVAKDPNYQPLVFVSTKKYDDHIEIIVKDNGNGIPKIIQDKIFQPFFTTKPTGEGTGLGLSLSYDIITKGHEGKVEIETIEGEGTSFIIQLPFK
jgi:signal transduction histidine kinase